MAANPRSIIGVVILGLTVLCVTELRRRVHLTLGAETIDIQVTGGLWGNGHQSIQREETASIGFGGASGVVID